VSAATRIAVRRWAPITAVLGLCFGGLLLQASPGDYGNDAGPAIAALSRGHLQEFFAVQPLMGSFAVIARVPFALAARVAGGGARAVYEAGVAACLLAACALAVGLVRLRGGRRDGALLLVPVLALLTPASRDAVRAGHPEEILAGALCVAAILLAGRRATWAGVALGLALVTKQWAVLAVAPAVLAAPRGCRARLAATAAGVAAACTVPLVVGDHGAFLHISHEAATAPRITSRATVWFLAARPHYVQLHLPAGFPSGLTLYEIPAWLAQATHPLIVLIAPVLAFAAWRRRGSAAAVLALLLLLRCVLDPVDNEYYHVPFLLALLAYETVNRRDVRGIPPATLFSAAGLWLTFDVLDLHGAAPQLTNAVYLAWTAPVLLYLLDATRLLPIRVLRQSRLRPRAPVPAVR
jgi:Glycosyltransferase family 87